MRTEKAYVNKLNLVLVQASNCAVLNAYDAMLMPNGSVLTDPQASLASRLAIVHSRDRCFVEDQPLPLRKQHDHPQAVIRRDLRLLG